MKEDLYNGRWLDLCQVLIGETRHRTLERLNLVRTLQCIFVGLVLDESAVSISNGHHDQTEDASEQEEEG